MEKETDRPDYFRTKDDTSEPKDGLRQQRTETRECGLTLTVHGIS